MKTSNYKKKIMILFLTSILCLLNFIQPKPTLALQDLDPLFQKALNDSKNGDFLSALKEWDLFLRLSPDDSAALSNRGNVRLALGDINGAIEDQTKSMNLKPSDPDPHLNRGIAEEALQLWDQARIDYEWILERYPNDSSALYNLGNVMGSQEDWTSALDLFNKASFARPGFAMARSSKALALYQLGKLEEAEDEFRSLIRKYSLFADARAGLSALLWKKGAFGEAESNWIAAAGLDNRYRDEDWLLHIRRWPSTPINDLMSFLALEVP